MLKSLTKARVALLTCVLLALVTLGVYWPAIRCEFVDFDDPFYVTKNVEVQHGLTWDSIRWSLTGRPAGNWHPLTWISHMLDCQLYGLNPAGHHVTNLLLHTANSILIFLILRRMTGAQWRSAFVAALFALHPLHVESVAWVAERKDVLSTFFWALTIWAYVRYAQTTDDRGQKTEDRGQTSDLRPLTSDLRPLTSDLRPLTSDLRPPTSDLRPPTSGSYWLVMLFFALGLLAKPMLVTLPFLLLLLDFWPLRRMPTTLRVFGREIRMADESGEPEASRVPLSRLVMEKLPLFVLAGLSCAATLWAQGYAVGILGIPFHIRLENALLSYLRYIEKMLWPTKLVVLYPFSWDILSWHPAVAILVVGCVTYLAIRYARACPYLFTGWFWYVGVLVPVIGLVQVGLQSMADRYTYVPSIGLFIIIAWGGYDLARRWQLRPAAVAVLAVLPILACIPLTRAQLAYWKDSVVLFENALRWTSDNFTAENNLGVTLSDRGQYEDACKHFAEAIRIFPKVPQPHFGRAFALIQLRKGDEAIPELLEAIRIQPDYPEALSNLGLLLVRQGKIDEAIARYRAAIRNDPNAPEFHCNLGYALVKKGELDDAIKELEAALRLKPDLPNARSELVGLLSRRGKLGEAKAKWTALLVREPNNAAAQTWLGLILMTEKDSKAALGHLKEAVRLRPNDSEAHLWLGDVLAETGMPDEARQQYSLAFASSPRPGLPAVFSQRAQALASQNQPAAAMILYQTALSYDPKLPSAHVGLAAVLSDQGKLAEAAEHLRVVLEATTNHWEAHDLLGMVLTKQHETREALREFSESARINPTNALVRCHLAMALEQRGQIKEAVAQYQEALRQNRTMPVVLNNLAWILASNPDPEIRNGAEAVRLAEQACQLTSYKGPMIVGTLSAAYAEAGRFDEAVEMAKKAQALAAAAGNTQLADKNKQMVELFLARRPFHDTSGAAANSGPATP